MFYNLFASLIMFVIACAMVLTFIFLEAETGPGCPADPAWIGYCSEIPQ